MGGNKVVWFAGALVATLVAAYPLVSTQPNGWRRSVHVADLGTVDMWTTKGWLCAERVSSSGQVGWDVVLAPVRPGQTPDVRYDTAASHLVLAYGHCYVEESPLALQIRRVRKAQSDATWPRLFVPAEAKVFGRSNNESEALQQFRTGSPEWDGVATGPARNECDALVRLGSEAAAQQSNEDGVSAGPASVSAWLADPPHVFFLDNGEHIALERDQV